MARVRVRRRVRVSRVSSQDQQLTTLGQAVTKQHQAKCKSYRRQDNILV